MAEAAEDPGWRRALAAAVIPSFVLRRRRDSADGLTLVRTMFVTFCNAIILISVVVVILDGTGDELGRMAALPVLIGVALVGLLGQLAFSLVRRPLDCTDSASLARSYLSRRVFAGLALSEPAAIVGFLGFMLTTEAWIYPVGAALTAVGFARTAPTRAQLRAEQAQLAAAGCSQSLVAALMQNKPGRS